MTARRMLALLAVAGIAVIGYRYIVPEIAESYVRRKLASNGYPDAELAIERVGLDHTQFSTIVLRPGLVLGDVGVDVGISALWGDRAHAITIRRARVSAAATAELARKTSKTGKKSRGPRLPAERIQIDDAQVTVGTTEVAGSARTAPAADGTIELSFEANARERGKPAWSAKGHGAITVAGDKLVIKKIQGQADLAMPTGELGGIAFTDAKVSADVTGTIAADKPDEWKLRITAARARAAGGELSVGPFDIVSRRPVDFVIHGRGLQLERLPGRKAIEASGVVDGRLAVRVEGSRVLPLDGELHARAGGRIRMTNPAWRRRVAGTAGSGHALQARIAGALTDLDYSQLTMTLAPPGTSPELRIAVRGRGHERRQELDLAVNLRGVRDIFQRLTNRTKPRSPK